MNKSNFLVAILALAGGFCLSPAASAQLDVTLTSESQYLTQGTTLVEFDGTILNPSSTNTIYLNGDNSTTTSPYFTISDTPFLTDAPLFLTPDQSSGLIPLFDVSLDSNTPIGTYSLNTFSILGGLDGVTFSDLADVNFSVTVTNPITVPEGGSTAMYLLLSLACCFTAILFRSRLLRSTPSGGSSISCRGATPDR